MNKKNILFILPFMPYPLESGGHQALFNGIRAIKDHYNVFVSYAAIDNDIYRRNEQLLLDIMPEITLLPLLHYPKNLSTTQKAYRSIKAIAKRIFRIKEDKRPSQIYDSWIPSVSPLDYEWAKHLESIFANHTIDLVQVEMPRMIGAIWSIPKDKKVIFVHHELAFVRHELELEHIKDISYANTLSEYTKMIELETLNKYNAILTLSEIDKQKLISAGIRIPVYSSFAVVDSAPYVERQNNRKILSFVGSDKHAPNYVGIHWFLKNCWPILSSKDSEYSIQIIGNWSDTAKSEIIKEYPFVKFLGFTPDLNEVASDTVMIIPILIGSGIRMKILEAASRGIPFVSTSVGAEGLPFVDGESGIIRDTPEGFVEGILSLQDEIFARKISDAAHDIVNQIFSFKSFAEDRIHILNQIENNA